VGEGEGYNSGGREGKRAKSLKVLFVGVGGPCEKGHREFGKNPIDFVFRGRKEGFGKVNGGGGGKGSRYFQKENNKRKKMKRLRWPEWSGKTGENLSNAEEGRWPKEEGSGERKRSLKKRRKKQNTGIS